MIVDVASSALRGFLDFVYFRNPNGEMFLYLVVLLASLGTLAVVATMRRSRRLRAYADRVTPTVPYLLLQCSVILVVSVEALVEVPVTDWLGWDFTPWVIAIEGSAVSRVQHALRASAAGPALDAVLIVVYTWGAFLLTVVPFLYLVFTGRVASIRRLAFTLAGVWAIGLVFYLCVPVWEVWYVDPTVENVLLGEASALTDSAIYRVNLNNNFPSLHTAVTVGIALALGYAGEKWPARVAGAIATGVVIATIYLGIHWFVDAIAGLALAFAIARHVHRREAARAGVLEPAPRAAPVRAIVVVGADALAAWWRGAGKR